MHSAVILNQMYESNVTIVPNLHDISIMSLISITYEILTEEQELENFGIWLNFLANVFDSNVPMDFASIVDSNVLRKTLEKLLEFQLNKHETLQELSTCVLAGWNVHLRQFDTNLLLQLIASNQLGSDSLGANLLRVINLFGYPNVQPKRLLHALLVRCKSCCRARLSFTNTTTVQLVQDLLVEPTTESFLYLNDYKILIEVVLRECTDLPVQEEVENKTMNGFRV